MKAMVLAGGYSQIQLINEIKSRGIKVLLADNNPNAVARPFTDEFVKADILDFERIKEIAAEEKVDFVITACADQVLLTSAWVSEELGLPCYIDYETACKVSDKAVMKTMCRDHNIPSSKYVIQKEFNPDELTHLRYPLVVKPVDGYSAKGITKVLEPSQLESAFDYAYGISRCKEIVIEEYVQGEEVTVDVYVENGVAKVLSISNTEKLKLDNVFLAFRTWHKATITEKACENIAVAAQQIADAFQLSDTPMLIQFIVDGDEVSALEYCARTGGGAKYVLLEKASGFNPFSTLVDLTLGKKPHIEVKPAENKYISNEFIYCNPGVFDHLEGFDELKEEGTISDYCVFKWPGAEIKTIRTSSDRAASFTIQADTVAEMKAKHERANSIFKVVDPQGNDLARHDLLSDLPYQED